jgi:hypothetical protein
VTVRGTKVMAAIISAATAAKVMWRGILVSPSLEMLIVDPRHFSLKSSPLKSCFRTVSPYTYAVTPSGPSTFAHDLRIVHSSCMDFLWVAQITRRRWPRWRETESPMADAGPRRRIILHQLALHCL